MYIRTQRALAVGVSVRNADINFSIGKDYIIVTGLDDYEKAKKILGKDAFNCNSEQK